MSHRTTPKNGFFRSLRNIAIAAASTIVFAVTLPANVALADNNRTFTDYAEVIHVEPSFRYVTVKVPQRICSPRYNNSGHHNNNSNNYHRRNRGQHFQSTATHSRNSAGAVFIGGIIGGAIGHEVSKSVSGRNNVAATVAGAVIGSTLAGSASQHDTRQSQYYAHNSANHQNRNHQSHKKPRKHHQRQQQQQQQHNNHQRCTTTTQSRQERRANGYDVTYIYHGRTFHTHTRHHPGHKIAVQIAVRTH